MPRTPRPPMINPTNRRPRSWSAVPRMRSSAQYTARIGRTYPTGPTRPRTPTVSRRPNGPPECNHSPRTPSAANTTRPTPRTSAAREVTCRAVRLPIALMAPERWRPRARPGVFFAARPRLDAVREDRFRVKLRSPGPLHRHDHRHDNRLSLRNLEKVAAEVSPDALFDHRLIRDLVGRARLERLQGEGPCLLQEIVGGLVEHEPAVDDVRSRQHSARMRVHGRDDDHDAVPGQLPAVAEDRLADVTDPETVHEDHPGLDARAAPHGIAQLNGISVLHDQDAVLGHAHLHGQPCVMGEMPQLAMDRDEPSRPNQVQHELQLFRRGVPRHVHG